MPRVQGEVMDHHEGKAIRRLGAAILARFAEDQVRIFHAAMHGKKSLLLVSDRVEIRDLDVEISSARRYMESNDFHVVCAIAGVEISVEPVIAHMLRMAKAYAGNGKPITAEMALSAWEAE